MIKKLSDEALENVNGGYVVCSRGMEGSVEDAPWQVIDDNTGEVLSNCKTYDDAVDKAKSHKVASHLVGQDFVQILRDWK